MVYFVSFETETDKAGSYPGLVCFSGIPVDRKPQVVQSL
jgi:hypothetical protein